MPSGPNIAITTKPDLSTVAAPFRKNYIKLIDEEMKGTANQIYLNIIGEAPRRSGDLSKAITLKRRSVAKYDIFVDRRKKGGKYEAAVRLGVPAGSINPILPRRKKALYWPGAAHPVRAVYNHPGIKANDYWTRGIKKSEKDFKQAEVVIGNKVSRKLTGT